MQPDITAAPAEITLGDKQYRMSPLTDKDISELDNWLRVRTLRLARESVAGASEEEARAVMRFAFEYTATLTWTTLSGSELMSTLDGVAQLIWQSVHHLHPEMTAEGVKELILDKRTFKAALDVFDMVNGIVPKKEGPSADPTSVQESSRSESASAESTPNSLPDTAGPQERSQT